ncbi:MAG: hypothetical protein O3B21_13220 [Proteobacteria bacterium]|nr:hypothetical protein [Pseudomonadota bacterium]MDA1356411.1 hypothetical protein [Pseudomonadota bacterium]
MNSAGMARRARRVQRQAKPQPSTRRRNYIFFVFVIASGLTVGGIALAITALPTFIILYGGMLPTLVAFLVDNQPGRYLFRTVGVSNAAGVIPFVQSSLHYSLNAGMIVSPAGRIETWLTIYGAALGGWLLSIAVPMVWQVAFELVLDVRKRRYQAAHDALAQEWDLDAPGSERDPT